MKENSMRTSLGIAFVLVGCSSAPEQKLPTASFTPHLDSQPTSVACGEDIAFYGNPAPDLRYAFTYDAAGRLSHADGAWASSGPTDTIDYTWAGDNLAHMLSVSGWDASEYEVTAHYAADNSLVDYTWGYTDANSTYALTYAYSAFAGVNQPTRLEITEQGDPTVWGYSFVYDTADRLVQAVPDAGAPTTWSYDDDAGTITSDTGNGAWTDVVTYDADFRLLSFAWGGNDPSVIEGEQVYTWNGDSLANVTYSSGTEQAPHQVSLVQTDTMRYDCSMARLHAGKTQRIVGAHTRR
jgi:YD repeat-containing protein